MKEWVKDIAIAVVIAIVIIQFIKPTIVKESSMEPNFYENDYLFIDKITYKFSEPKLGDVVVFHSSLTTASGKEKLLIKRVIGVEGDTIDVKDGDVYVNNKKLEEPYTKDGITNGGIDGLVVPKGEVFCMGDNRLVSVDSRSPEVGCIDVDEIVGRIFLRAYPFNKFGIIHRF